MRIYTATSLYARMAIMGFLRNSGKKRSCTEQRAALKAAAPNASHVTLCLPVNASAPTADDAGKEAAAIVVATSEGGTLAASCYDPSVLKSLSAVHESVGETGVDADMQDAEDARAPPTDGEPTPVEPRPASLDGEPTPVEPRSEPQHVAVVAWPAGAALGRLEAVVYRNGYMPLLNAGDRKTVETELENVLGLKGGLASQYMDAKRERRVVLLFPKDSAAREPTDAVAMAFGVVKRERGLCILTLYRIARISEAPAYCSSQPDGKRWMVLGMTPKQGTAKKIRWVNEHGKQVKTVGHADGSPNPFVAMALQQLIQNVADEFGDLSCVIQEPTLPCAQNYHKDHCHGPYPAMELIFRSLGFEARGDGSNAKHFVLDDPSAAARGLAEILESAEAGRVHIARSVQR